MNLRSLSLPLLIVGATALSACAGANAKDDKASQTDMSASADGGMPMGQMGGGHAMNADAAKAGGGAGMAAMSPQQMQQMQGRMAQMHSLMHRIDTAKTPAERQRLQQEQMQLMQQNMQAMMPMMMSMMHGGGMCGMSGGTPKDGQTPGPDREAGAKHNGAH